jgi:cytoskeletal protein RodZ
MATRRKRNLNFLPAETRTEPVIDISAYPVDIGVGELMRLTRERLGHELQTVANQLRIRLSYLEAIEDARFRDLPGTTYAVGFVRSYADYLGLDGADIVRRFREEAARIHGQTKLVFPALTAEGKLPRAAVLLVSAVGLAAVYGVWYYISSRQQSDLPIITEVPDRLAALAPESASDVGDEAPIRPLDSPPTETPATAQGPTPAAALQMPAASVESGTGTASAATPREPAAEAPAPAGGSSTEPAPPAAPVAAAPMESAPPAAAAGSTDAVPPSPSPSPSAPAAGAGTEGATAVGSDAANSGDAAQPGSAAAAEGASGSAAAPAAQPAPPAAPDVAANDIPAAPSLPAITGPDATQQAAATPPADAVAAGVVLEARMDSWIKVVDAKGKTVTQLVLKAGERYVVPDQPGLVLRTGNAGGLDVIVGGRKAPPLGEVGTVLTKVSLEPSRLLDGTAVTD